MFECSGFGGEEGEACGFVGVVGTAGAALVSGAALVAGALVSGLKLLYARPRPPLDDRLIAVGGFSLPSGRISTFMEPSTFMRRSPSDAGRAG